MSESTIQTSICEYLELRRHFFWRSNNTAIYDSSRKIFRALPKYAKKGVPDIIVIQKGTGTFIGLEVKKPKPKKTYQSKDQKLFESGITACGGLYYVVRSIDDVQAIGL